VTLASAPASAEGAIAAPAAAAKRKRSRRRMRGQRGLDNLRAQAPEPYVDAILTP
jgi:hypothetical protein